MTAPAARDVARQLPQAMVRLRARLRAESEPAGHRWTWSQITTLGRIAREGSTTVSVLAAAEHVRPQSMAETVALLRRDGLIATTPDPSDGRKTLLAVTDAGRDLIESIPAIRETWLEGAVDRNLSATERQTLAQAAQIMERLADC